MGAQLLHWDTSDVTEIFYKILGSTKNSKHFFICSWHKLKPADHCQTAQVVSVYLRPGNFMPGYLKTNRHTAKPQLLNREAAQFKVQKSTTIYLLNLLTQSKAKSNLLLMRIKRVLTYISWIPFFHQTIPVISKPCPCTDVFKALAVTSLC